MHAVEEHLIADPVMQILAGVDFVADIDAHFFGMDEDEVRFREDIRSRL